MNTKDAIFKKNLAALKVSFYKIIYKPLVIPAPHLKEQLMPRMSHHTKQEIDDIINKLKGLDLSNFQGDDESQAAAYMMLNLLPKHIKNYNILIPDFLEILLQKIPVLNINNFEDVVYSLVGEYIEEVAEALIQNKKDSHFYENDTFTTKHPLLSYVNPAKILQISRFHAENIESKPHSYYDQDYLKSFFVHFITPQYVDIYWDKYAKEIDLILSLVLTDTLVEHTFLYDTDMQFYNYYNSQLVGAPNEHLPIHRKLIDRIIELNYCIAKKTVLNKISPSTSCTGFIQSVNNLIEQSNRAALTANLDLIETSRQVHIEAFNEFRGLLAQKFKTGSFIENKDGLKKEFFKSYTNIFHKVDSLSNKDIASIIPSKEINKKAEVLNYLSNKIKSISYLNIFSSSLEIENFKTAQTLIPQIIDYNQGLKTIADGLYFSLHKHTLFDSQPDFENLLKIVLSFENYHNDLFALLLEESSLHKLFKYRSHGELDVIDKKGKIKDYNSLANEILNPFLEQGIITKNGCDFIKWYFLYTKKSNHEFIDFLLITQNIKSLEVLSVNEKIKELIEQRAFYLYNLIQIYNTATKGAKPAKYKIKASTFNSELIEKIYIEKHLSAPPVGTALKTTKL